MWKNWTTADGKVICTAALENNMTRFCKNKYVLTKKTNICTLGYLLQIMTTYIQIKT